MGPLRMVHRLPASTLQQVYSDGPMDLRSEPLRLEPDALAFVDAHEPVHEAPSMAVRVYVLDPNEHVVAIRLHYSSARPARTRRAARSGATGCRSGHRGCAGGRRAVDGATSLDVR